ncbi:DinB family protein [Flavobacteriaceae bacterium]|nr:DinB family protein [Flavobacteriaceae bacterium]MDB4187691.1 DinB family protein [Flavobacteriaceae bacterium]
MNKTFLWEKETIVEAIATHHAAFVSSVESLGKTAFEFSWKNKWTPGQQLVHIRKSIEPVVLAFWLPRFVLKHQFGLTNRPSRTYEELVARYLKALGNNKALAPKRFAPKSLPFSSREKEFKAYQKSVKRLVSVAQKCTEEELDKYVIPHPLIGKLTLREMLFFCVYHVQHHNKLTEEIIQNQ